MKKGAKTHYVKKSPHLKEDSKTTESPSKTLGIEHQVSDPETKAILLELADLKESAENNNSLVKPEKSSAELAKLIYSTLTNFYKSKKSTSDLMLGIIRTRRGISVLKDLSNEELSEIIGIIIDLIKSTKVKIERIACFRLLYHLIMKHTKISDHMEKFTDLILSYCSKIGEEPEISRHAFGCLGNLLCQYNEQLKVHCDQIIELTLGAFYNVMASFNTEIPSQIKEIKAITRCLAQCLTYPKNMQHDNLEQIFLKLYKLLFIGTSYANYKIYSVSAPSSKIAENKGIASSSSSGSEISDPEDTAQIKKSGDYDKYGKLRIYCLLCIQQMCRLNDKFIFDKWHLLLPRYAFSTPVPILKTGHKWELDSERLKKWCSVSTEPNILSLMQISKDSKVRVAVANTISSLIEHSPIKMWQGSLGTVKNAKKTSNFAFTSLSEVLGNVIISLHYLLIHYLSNESDYIVQLPLLKSLSILLSVTQYQKIPPGLITYILLETIWKKFIPDLKNENLVLASINCFTSVANQRFAYPEFEQNFLNQTGSANIIQFILNNSEKEYVCRANECLIFFTKVCKNYPLSLLPFWPKLLPFIKLVFKDSLEITTLNCVRIIEEYIKHYNSLVYMDQTVPSCSDIFDNKDFISMLENLISGNMTLKCENASDMQTELLCILGYLSEIQWQKLTPEVVGKAVNFAMKLKVGGLPQSVALKCIGSMITYKMFNSDSKFVDDTITKIILNKPDFSMMVATKNSWALANLAYCLENLSKLSRFNELTEIAFHYSKSTKEKVCSNGIRALGYILKKCDLIDKLKIGKDNLDNVLSVIVNKLSVKSPKISWNACVAIANILANEKLPKTCLLYAPATFNALISVICEKPNIKTKIHAIQALQAYKSIEEFGISYEKLMKGLINTYNDIGKLQLEDVTEYKYRDKLEYGIIDTICYLLNIYQNTEKDADLISGTILNSHAADLLNAFITHLRKLFKIESSEPINKEDAIKYVKDNEPILLKIKQIAVKLSDWIKKSSKAHVSFGIVDQIHEIGNTELVNFPFMQLLVLVKEKPKFIQTFT